MDRWIAFDKGDFIGRQAAAAEKQKNSPPLRLVTLEVDADDAEASGYEPVWNGSKRIGYVSSGGYGHAVDKSLAMALVEPEFSEPGTKLTCHIVGQERPVKVIAPSPYDPAGKQMRI
jgi:dimethylglycine dehydrogenase